MPYVAMNFDFNDLEDVDVFEAAFGMMIARIPDLVAVAVITAKGFSLAIAHFNEPPKGRMPIAVGGNRHEMEVFCERIAGELEKIGLASVTVDGDLIQNLMEIEEEDKDA